MESAKSVLIESHKIADLEVEAHHFDVLIDWQRVVTLS